MSDNKEVHRVDASGDYTITVTATLTADQLGLLREVLDDARDAAEDNVREVGDDANDPDVRLYRGRLVDCEALIAAFGETAR